MFVLSILQVLLILQPLVTYSQNSTIASPSTTEAFPVNNNKYNNTEEASEHQGKVIKINVTAVTTTTTTTKTTTNKPNAVVDIEGGTVHLEATTLKSTIDLPVTPTTAVNVKTHLGREGVTEDVKVEGEHKKTNNSQTNSSTTTTTAVQNESVSVLSEHISNKQINTLDDVSANATHSKIVPKKGVDFGDMPPAKSTASTMTDAPAATSPSTTISKIVTIPSVATTTKPRPKKPTVTIGDDDEQADVILRTHKNSNSTPKVPTIENYEQSKQHNKSTFVIPIVIVILSVPLVAIVINIVYKRGKEWWTHRHYSRMDFLIDGMYNN